ncbi:MAG TPA: glycosyltransferase [Bryobacteraceae bacterium]|nr:glycosyltransferase [Bryobacteraceae bacterium]
MTVGFYSPLPPALTGVADYAAALLEALRSHGHLEIAPERCDSALYHLGNNILHADVYRRALERPGVAVLHDTVLQHFLLGQSGESAYVEEFVYNYGEWSRGLAHDLWRGRATSAADQRYFGYPMLRRIAERSRAVVVHNPAAARMVRAHAPAAQVVEIPHLFQEPPAVSPAEALRFRQQIGIAPDVFCFGVFGYLRESKRLIPVLNAFRTLHRGDHRTALLVAGRFASSDLERAVAPLLASGNIVRVPYLPGNAFWTAAQAVDACINLKYPAAGETSGIAIRLMGIAKPVLLTEGEECACYPEDGCLRIAAGMAERDSLLQHMVLLTSMADVAGIIGRRGARHIREHHEIGRIAEQYWKTLCEYRC